jgi:hypothetical protein
MFTQLRELFIMPQDSSMQNLGIFGAKYGILFQIPSLSQFWLNWKNQKSRGPPVSRLVQTTAPPVPIVSRLRSPPCHPPYPPPTISTASATASRDFNRRTPPMSSPFRPSSSAHTQPLLLLAPCQRRPPHIGPPSTAPSGHPSTQPPLLPAQHVPPWSYPCR